MLSLTTSKYTGGWFAAPALAGLFLFVALPFILAIALAFTNMRLGSPLPTRFVGLEQFTRTFSDPIFLRALINNVLFTAVVVPLQTAGALGLALLLDRTLRGQVIFRTLFFMPVVFPLSLVSVVWILILAPGPQGLLNNLLEILSFGLWIPRDFLRDTTLALPAIMLTSLWQGIGFQMIIMLAGLQAIPSLLYDAAAVDGAKPWQQFFSITLPQLRNTIIFVVLATTILAFRLYDQIQIMTQGGPDNATTTLMYEAVQTAFERQQVARGSAMTVVLFVLVLVITWLLRVIMGKNRRTG